MHFFIDPSDLTGNTLRLSEALRHHWLDVLRLKTGDHLSIVVGKEKILHVRIMLLNSELMSFDVLKDEVLVGRQGPRLVLIQSYPKGDKMADILNACTQLGVSEVIPILSSRTVVRIPDAMKRKKESRLRRILMSAAEQSESPFLPMLHPIQSFNQFVEAFSLKKNEQALVPWEEERQLSLKQALTMKAVPQVYYFFIGPEGGLSSEEVFRLSQIGFQSVSLGKSILRVEIAAVTAVSQLQFFLS